MSDMMSFPNTVEEFMESYKVIDSEGIYMSKGSELVPIFRMKQWFDHIAQPEQRWIPCTDPTKLPKNKELWITCEICGCRVLKEIYWDMTEWSDDVSGLIAYKPYVEPEPYRGEGD